MTLDFDICFQVTNCGGGRSPKVTRDASEKRLAPGSRVICENLEVTCLCLWIG